MGPRTSGTLRICPPLACTRGPRRRGGQLGCRPGLHRRDGRIQAPRGRGHRRHPRHPSLDPRLRHPRDRGRLQLAGQHRPQFRPARGGSGGCVHELETRNALLESTQMTAVSEAGVETGSCDGTVTGAPRRWLQLEGATLLVGTLVAFSTTHRSWWLIPLVLFLPDLFAAGYLGGSRIGANLYNVAHATPVPTLLVGLGWWQHNSIVLGPGLLW